MQFVKRAPGNPRKLALFPGSFHPPTCAHLALAQAALKSADEVVWLLPREFPHKQYGGVTLEQRLSLLDAVTAREPRFSAAVTEGGLFIDMARESRAEYGPGMDVWIVCGRDAAERIVNWDYGEQGDFAGQLREFGLLVADRAGCYTPPPALEHRIRPLAVDRDYNAVSATEVRRRIAAGEPWESLVPAGIVELVNGIYRRGTRLQ